MAWRLSSQLQRPPTTARSEMTFETVGRDRGQLWWWGGQGKLLTTAGDCLRLVNKLRPSLA